MYDPLILKTAATLLFQSGLAVAVAVGWLCWWELQEARNPMDGE